MTSRCLLSGPQTPMSQPPQAYPQSGQPTAYSSTQPGQPTLYPSTQPGQPTAFTNQMYQASNM